MTRTDSGRVHEHTFADTTSATTTMPPLHQQQHEHNDASANDRDRRSNHANAPPTNQDAAVEEEVTRRMMLLLGRSRSITDEIPHMSSSMSNSSGAMMARGGAGAPATAAAAAAVSSTTQGNNPVDEDGSDKVHRMTATAAFDETGPAIDDCGTRDNREDDADVATGAVAGHESTARTATAMEFSGRASECLRKERYTDALENYARALHLYQEEIVTAEATVMSDIDDSFADLVVASHPSRAKLVITQCNAAGCLRNMGAIHRMVDGHDDAVNCWRRAESIYRECQRLVGQEIVARGHSTAQESRVEDQIDRDNTDGDNDTEYVCLDALIVETIQNRATLHCEHQHEPEAAVDCHQQVLRILLQLDEEEDESFDTEAYSVGWGRRPDASSELFITLEGVGFCSLQDEQYKDMLMVSLESLECLYQTVAPRDVETLRKTLRILQNHCRDRANDVRGEDAGDRELVMAVTRLLRRLSGMYFEQGDLSEAEDALQEAMETKLSCLLDDELPSTDAAIDAMDQMGLTHESMKNYDKALSCYEQALLARSRQLGNNHIDVARSLMKVAAVMERQGNENGAVDLYLEAHSIYSNHLSSDSFKLRDADVGVLLILATVLMEQEDQESAVIYLLKLLEIAEDDEKRERQGNTTVHKRIDRRQVYFNLGKCYVSSHDYVSATVCLVEASKYDDGVIDEETVFALLQQVEFLQRDSVTTDQGEQVQRNGGDHNHMMRKSSFSPETPPGPEGFLSAGLKPGAMRSSSGSSPAAPELGVLGDLNTNAPNLSGSTSGDDNLDHVRSNNRKRSKNGVGTSCNRNVSQQTMDIHYSLSAGRTNQIITRFSDQEEYSSIGFGGAEDRGSPLEDKGGESDLFSNSHGVQSMFESFADDEVLANIDKLVIQGTPEQQALDVTGISSIKSGTVDDSLLESTRRDSHSPDVSSSRSDESPSQEPARVTPEPLPSKVPKPTRANAQSCSPQGRNRPGVGNKSPSPGRSRSALSLRIPLNASRKKKDRGSSPAQRSKLAKAPSFKFLRGKYKKTPDEEPVAGTELDVAEPDSSKPDVGIALEDNGDAKEDEYVEFSRGSNVIPSENEYHTSFDGVQNGPIPFVAFRSKSWESSISQITFNFDQSNTLNDAKKEWWWGATAEGFGRWFPAGVVSQAVEAAEGFLSAKTIHAKVQSNPLGFHFGEPSMDESDEDDDNDDDQSQDRDVRRDSGAFSNTAPGTKRANRVPNSPCTSRAAPSMPMHRPEAELIANVHTFEQQLRSHQQDLGKTHPKVAEHHFSLALMYARLGRGDAAVASAKKALQIHESGNDLYNIAQCHHLLAGVYLREEDYESSLVHYSDALRFEKQYHGNYSEEVAKTLNCMGTVYALQNEFGMAMDSHQEALCILKECHGEDPKHPLVSQTLCKIGSVYYRERNSLSAKANKDYSTFIEGGMLEIIGRAHEDCGSYSIAISFFEEKLQLLESADGEDSSLASSSPEEVAITLNSLGMLNARAGFYVEAVDYYDRALEIQLQLGCDEVYIATARVLNASVQFQFGRWREALTLLENSYTVLEEELGDDHETVAAALLQIGVVRAALSENEAAAEALQQAFDTQAELLGEDHPATLRTRREIGNLHSIYKSDLDYALNEFEEILAEQREIHGDKHPNIAETLHSIGCAYARKGDYRKAMRALEECYFQRVEFLGCSHPLQASTLHEIAKIHVARGRIEKAVEICEAVLTIRRESLSEHHVDIAKALSTKGGCLVARGDVSGAMKCFMEALPLIEKSVGSSHPAVADVYCQMCSMHLRKCRFDEARDAINRALELYRKAKFRDDHPCMQDATAKLERVDRDEMLYV